MAIDVAPPPAYLVEALDNINSAIAGKSLDEAIELLGVTHDGGVVKYSVVFDKIDDVQAVSSGVSASGILEIYEDAGGTYNKFGSATSAKTYAYNIVLTIIDDEVVAGVLMSAAEYSSIAISSAQVGYSIGEKLYELIDERPAVKNFFSNVARRLVEATTVYQMPAIGIAGVWLPDKGFYLPTEAVDAVADALYEVAGEPKGYTSYFDNDGSTIYCGNIRGWVTVKRTHEDGSVEYKTISPSGSPEFPDSDAIISAYWADYGPYYDIVYAWDHFVSGITTASHTIEGKTVWYYSNHWRTRRPDYYEDELQGVKLPNGTARKTGASIWNSVFGDKTEAPYALGEGLDDYNGFSDRDSVISVLIGEDASGHILSQYEKVRLPEYKPDSGREKAGTSPRGDINPDPSEPDDPDDVLPYISPTLDEKQYPQEIDLPNEQDRQAPIYNPIENRDPFINPSYDPSQPTNPPEQSGESPEEQSSSGESETPPIFDIIPGTGNSFIPPAGQSGMIHVYNPTASKFWSFAQWLWQTFATADPLNPTIWSNPFDGVISAHEIYCTPTTDGEDVIRCGYLACPTTAGLVRQRYVTINCGSMVIPEKLGNYLDYSPYTKCNIFLPFIGIVELNPDHIVGHGVNVQYNIDCYTGTCVAFITVAKNDYENTVYEYEGDCSSELPLSGGSMAAVTAARRSARSSVIGGIASGLASIASAGFMGHIGTGIASGLGQMINAVLSPSQMSAKTDVSHSGGFTGCAGAMSAKKPYIMVSRPIQKVVTQYPSMYGYNSHENVLLGACSGLTKCLSVHVVSATATQEEKNMIESLLTSGVFL